MQVIKVKILTNRLGTSTYLPALRNHVLTSENSECAIFRACGTGQILKRIETLKHQQLGKRQVLALTGKTKDN